jgi:hypothetical protein
MGRWVRRDDSEVGAAFSLMADGPNLIDDMNGGNA